MHCALAVVAILVLSWAPNGEGGTTENGLIEAARPGRELMTTRRSAEKANPKPDEKDASERYQYTSLKDIIPPREDIKKDSGEDTSPKKGQAKAAFKKETRCDHVNQLSKNDAGSSSEKRKKEWHEYLCL